LREQLDSIFRQTVLPSELVISDDASSDATLSIIADAVAALAATPGRDPLEVRVLTNSEALGLVPNFQVAVSACSGELIALCDQDDVWADDRIERAVAIFARDPELLLLHSDAHLIDSSGAKMGVTLFESLGITSAIVTRVHDGDAFDVLMRRNIVTGATTIFRRSLAKVAFPVPAGWLHDEWLALVAAAVGRVDLSEDRLVEYRQHGGNLVGARRLSLAQSFGRMVEPGSQRNARLLVRATSLAERLPAIPGVQGEKIVAVRQKLIHEEVRSRLSAHRLARVFPVVREFATGRYTKFGRGGSDAVRDILQPLPGPR